MTLTPLVVGGGYDGRHSEEVKQVESGDDAGGRAPKGSGGTIQLLDTSDGCGQQRQSDESGDDSTRERKPVYLASGTTSRQNENEASTPPSQHL